MALHEWSQTAFNLLADCCSLNELKKKKEFRFSNVVEIVFSGCRYHWAQSMIK